MRSIVALGPAEARALVCPWCGRTPERGDRAFKVVRDGVTIGALVLASAVTERDLCPPGASVIERLWVAPADVGENVGTQLVQRACAVLVVPAGRVPPVPVVTAPPQPQVRYHKSISARQRGARGATFVSADDYSASCRAGSAGRKDACQQGGTS